MFTSRVTSPFGPLIPVVGDRDRIRLHTVEFESAQSAGSFCADGVLTQGDEDSCILLPEWAIRCGPRKTIYFNPKQVRAALSP